MIRIDSKESQHVNRKFQQCWLSRYPLPIRCVRDMGDEFIGGPFQQPLVGFSVKDAQSTSKNPQSNSICERMHQTVANVLRTLLYRNPPKNMTQTKDIMDNAIATDMHAMPTTVTTTLGSTPGTLAFSSYMFLNVHLVADWQTISCKREHHLNKTLRKANANLRSFDYAEGQQVLKKLHNPKKLGVRTTGTYPIQRVHVNGNLTIELRPGLLKKINIRRLVPYHLNPMDPT